MTTQERTGLISADNELLEPLAQAAHRWWGKWTERLQDQSRYVIAIVVSNTIDGVVQYLSGDSELLNVEIMLGVAGLLGALLALFVCAGGSTDSRWWYLHRYVVELFVAGAITGAFACFWAYGSTAYVIGSVAVLGACLLLFCLFGALVVVLGRARVAAINVAQHRARGVFLTNDMSRQQVQRFEQQLEKKACVL